MTKRQKRLARIRQNPKNVTFEDLAQVLEDYGFELKRSKGSHHIFESVVDNKVRQLVIPYRKPHIKAVHVKKAINLIEEIISLLGINEENDR